MPLIESLYTPIDRVLTDNAQSPTYMSLAPQTGEPSGEGVFANAKGGMLSYNRVWLLPLGEGPPGGTFTLRLYGWRDFAPDENKAGSRVWIPFFIAELLCSLCELTGPPGDANGDWGRGLRGGERLCDAITLTLGNVGLGGLIDSTGPGTNLAAHASVYTYAAKLIQFDFQADVQVNTNCLFAFA